MGEVGRDRSRAESQTNEERMWMIFILMIEKIFNILKAKHEHRNRALAKSRKSRKNLRRVKNFVIS